MKKIILKMTVVTMSVITYSLFYCITSTFAQDANKSQNVAVTHLTIKNGQQILPVFMECTPVQPYSIVTQTVAPNGDSEPELLTWIRSRFFTGVPLDVNAIIITHFDTGAWGMAARGDSVQIIKWKK